MLVTFPLPLLDVERFRIVKAWHRARHPLVYCAANEETTSPILHRGVQEKTICLLSFPIICLFLFFSSHCHSEFDLDILLQSVKSNIHW